MKKKMIFTALEIGSGDAFLIENEGKNFLFDSGGSKTKIIELLKRKKKSKIDVAICSHNDSDHSMGFIGLLEDPKIDIVEIWLPGTWIPILKFLIDNRIDNKSIFQYFSPQNGINKNEELIDYDSLIEKTDINIKEFDEDLQYISEIIDSPFCQLLFYFHSRLDIIIKLDRIIKIAGLAYKNGCLIRWFEPNKNNTMKQPYNYNFNPLNSKEVTRIDCVKEVNFLKLILLTEENTYSLVFELYENDIPVLLFSADSDYSFLKNNLVYNNNIIITSPHHGSESNDIAYKLITGKEIIWVRSDRKSSKRPSIEFLKNTNKYCLCCYKKNKTQEIKFRLNQKHWEYLSGMECEC